MDWTGIIFQKDLNVVRSSAYLRGWELGGIAATERDRHGEVSFFELPKWGIKRTLLG